jgi:hypothetical protein
MSTRIMMALATILAVGTAATALADSVDGKPTDGADRHPPASLRGSPAILFEDRGAQFRPLEACATDDAYGGAASCGGGGVF